MSENVSEAPKPDRGWAWPARSRKAHYFVGGRSLCGKWGWLGGADTLYDTNHNSSDNCASCKRRRADLKTETSCG